MMSPPVSILSSLPADWENCWSRTGIYGDRTCGELASVSHCTRCHTYSLRARQFLNQPFDEEERAQWTKTVSREDGGGEQSQALFIFRVGGEWLACPPGFVSGVLEPRKIHTVPHRSCAFLGLVNYEGRLTVCLSLEQLAGFPDAASGDGSAAGTGGGPVVFPRFVVMRHEAARAAFPVAEAAGLSRVGKGMLRETPVTVARGRPSLLHAFFFHRGVPVNCLEIPALFEAVKRAVK